MALRSTARDPCAGTANLAGTADLAGTVSPLGVAWIAGTALLAGLSAACGEDSEPGPARDATASPGADASADAGASADGGGDGADATASDPDAAGEGEDLYGDLDPELQELFDLINEERTSVGAPPVELRQDLICAAQAHAEDDGAAAECDHEGSDGSGIADRIAACGGSVTARVSETLACGTPNPRSAVDAWLQSDGHRDIMLGEARRDVGVGVSGSFWVAVYHD